MIVAPERAFGGDFDRGWLLAVQLYSVRSDRNWGIGDFTDLAGLVRLAKQLGADGVGLNPLHVLFDNHPADCSPYSPNSRLFLNPLYIDVEAIPEFSADLVPDAAATAARLREGDRVPYADMAALKWLGLARRLRQFREKRERRPPQRVRRLPRGPRAAVVPLCLLRGAAASLRGAVVGMAARMAAAGRSQMRRAAQRSRQARGRVRRIRAMDGR